MTSQTSAMNESSPNVIYMHQHRKAVDRGTNTQYTKKGDTKTTDGDGGDGMEARVAKLEAHLEHIRSDITEVKADIKDVKKDAESNFRILFRTIIVAAIGLVGIVAKGFGWF